MAHIELGNLSEEDIKKITENAKKKSMPVLVDINPRDVKKYEIESTKKSCGRKR